MSETKSFLNGFTSWAETHFEVVDFITVQRLKKKLKGVIKEIQEQSGTGGFYEISVQWTNEFEEKHKNTIWGEDLDFFDTIEEFLIEKNQKP